MCLFKHLEIFFWIFAIFALGEYGEYNLRGLYGQCLRLDLIGYKKCVITDMCMQLFVHPMTYRKWMPKYLY